MLDEIFQWLACDTATRNMENEPHTVKIIAYSLPACDGWKLATSLKRDTGDDFGFGQFRAESYEELIDHPVEMGYFTHASFDACGTRHDIVLADDIMPIWTDCVRI